MKNYKSFAILTAALLLSSCNAGDSVETTSAVTLEQTTTASVQTDISQTTQTADYVISETTAAEITVQTTTSAQPAETVQTTLAATVADEEAVETTTELETELLGGDDGAAIFYDKNSQKDYIILNVTPQKVYWNETDGYKVTVGQAMDIAIPAIFEEWLTDADGVMIYMGDGWNKVKNMTFDDTTVMGMSFPQYWSKDYLCPIVSGTVVFGEYTDDINGSFSRVDDGVYIEEANYSYPENSFGDGMTVDNLDLYFETIKADYDALKLEMAAHPERDYDIAGFWGYQDGVRFRATINYIY